MKYKILEWDSEFFHVKVATITEPYLNKARLKILLDELKCMGVRLVYWASARELSAGTIADCNGCLVDRKITFNISFDDLKANDFDLVSIVEPFSVSMNVKELEYLAIESNVYSRFVADPNISNEKAADLYKIWINKSLAKEIADEVLVIRNGKQVVGMVTLGEKGGRGDVGLIAVDRNFRGMRYGEALILAAQKWFVMQDYKSGQVVTQGENIPACKLYSKCGYLVEKIEYFYHFWL